MRKMMLFALAMAALGAAGPSAPAGRLEAAPVGDGLRVHVHKRGLFSGFAHDHNFEVTRWQASVDLPGDAQGDASLTLTAAADSLRDREPGLSDSDRKTVEAQTAGPAVLDAADFPQIVYRAGVPVPAAGAGPSSGTIEGELTLHGHTAPVEARYEARPVENGWRVDGSARFRQSAFGIKPYSGAGGTVGVKDEVEVTFAVVVRQGSP